MDLRGNVIINIYSIAILLIIGFHSFKNDEKKSYQYKLYIMMLNVTIISLIFDIFGRLDGMSSPIYPILNNIGNFLNFTLNLLLPSIWLLYVHNQIFPEESTKKLIYPLMFINLINFTLVILTQFFGWYYFIDSNNIYHRGPLFNLSALFIIGLLLIAFIKIIRNRKVLVKSHYLSLLFFAIPPLIGLALQIIIYGVSIVLNSVVLSLLIVFINIQNHNMSIDYLTGVYNRKKLESYLDEKISLCTKHKTFSAIMVDLNNFKYINDNFGHYKGDAVLQVSAKILNSCIRSSDFIARYGGDEFFVVLETYNLKDLEMIVDRIKMTVKKYNQSSNQPYEIGFSMGYAVYDYDANMKTEEFERYIDGLMYENKKSKL
ncbi:MAG: GGDEF domain-containing protein [Tissierellia bacterium]|nr:GGDEF domain-containing protein [Tissierellia bacterium]